MTTRLRSRTVGGRPPAPKGARRTVGVRVRLTPAEHARLIERARDARLSLATFIRQAAGAGGPVSRTVPAIHVAVVGELNRIGNNLNQAVHLLHTGYLSSDFARALEELEGLLRSLKRRLLGLPPDDPGS